MRCRLVWVMFLLAPALPGQQYPFIPVANSPRNIEHMLQDGQGRLWIATHDDVLCFDGSRFFSLRELGLPPTLNSLSDDGDGGILMTSTSDVYRFSRGRLEHIFSRPGEQDAIGVSPGIVVAAVAASRDEPFAVLFRIARA